MTSRMWYRTVQLALIFITGFIALTTIWGGISLIMDPTGEIINMKGYLQLISFADNYYNIGIALICTVGLSQLVATFLLIIHYNRAGIYVVIVGIILSLWSALQIFIFGWLYYSYIYLIFSLVQIALAITFHFVLKKALKAKSKQTVKNV